MYSGGNLVEMCWDRLIEYEWNGSRYSVREICICELMTSWAHKHLLTLFNLHINLYSYNDGAVS